MIRITTLVSKSAVMCSFLLIFCWGSIAHASLPEGITVSISASKAIFSADDDVSLDITYKNTSSQAIKFLKWGTALEGRINEDILSVMFDGDELSYIGRHYKRAAPQDSDYVTIAAKRSVTTTINLTEAYDVQSRGDYGVSYRLEQLSPSEQLRSEQVQFKQTVTKFKLSQDLTIPTYKQPSEFVGCTASRIDTINQATSAAESIAIVASRSMRDAPVTERANAQRYDEWFGTYSVGRWNRVQQNFDRISGTLSNRRIKYNCTCTESAFAYVFAGRPYEVFLCNAFWRAPLTGTDSKAGTIVHELSHFTVVADTDDAVYGQSGARNLANTNPARAIQNADSHEYFAENTPFRSMPPPAPITAPDLVVASRALSSASAFPESPLSISGSIENRGDDDAAATSVVLTILGSSISPRVSQTSIPAIAQGDSADFLLSFTSPSQEGSYTATVCVTRVSNESNTGNNCASAVALTVEGLPTVIEPMIYLLLE